jgi:2-keto-4-pentenoate hydratase/2-oxohepta-3-ene-1,7-dioic acid hydratase in catechol pathway
MKLGMIRTANAAETVGAVFGGSQGEGLAVVDVVAAARAAGAREIAATTRLIDLVRSWPHTQGVLAELVEDAAQGKYQNCVYPESEVQWQVPLPYPAHFICTGKNFAPHPGLMHPVGFIKLPSAIAPHNGTMTVHKDLRNLDYEVEIAVVIGRDCRNVTESAALDYVFGYTVFQDLSARDWQHPEMAALCPLLGKNFPGSGPIGPWICTADEIPDPSTMVLELSVNGERRQYESAAAMTFNIRRLVAHWSQIGLNGGDVITTGNPAAGIASKHKPDPQEWYLRRGDVVEATVEPIGTLRTSIF